MVDELPASRLTPKRIARAILLGALTGGGLTVVMFVVNSYLLPGTGVGVQDEGSVAGVLLVWFLLALLILAAWGAGIVLLGGPLWLVLHKLGARQRVNAMIVGALLAGSGGYVLGLVARAPHPVAWFLAFALIGTLSGYVVWKHAYRPARVNTP